MKVVFDKAELLAAITPAMGAISSRRDNPILECMKINAKEEGVRITTYDNEKGFHVDMDANVIEEGCCLINAQRFFGMVKNMPGDITLECGKNMIATLSSERSQYEIQYQDPKLYPNLTEISGRQSFTLLQSQLRDVITQTMFAIAENNDRLQLNGAYFTVDNGYIHVVALDGLRFAERMIRDENIIKTNIEVAADTEVQFIIPKKSLIEVIKLLEDPDEKITVVKARRHVTFKVKNVTFHTALIDGDYIQYRRFIPKNETTTAIVNTAQLRDSLERALFITEYKEAGRLKAPVKLNFYDGLLNVSSVSSSNRMSDDIAAVKTGEDLEIGFNCRMLLDTFRVLESEKIKLKLTTPLSAMAMVPVDDDDDSFLYFTFPTRIAEGY
ncbi:MAG: DNA polymerase III subunit beta [Clostridia bacterium]|nr:DNA polymerase III subunit beta [Clostridia bacterium]